MFCRNTQILAQVELSMYLERARARITCSEERSLMEYEPEFERNFMRRTLEIVRGYDGPYDATLLLNCLLGLLIVPKEKSIDRIPQDPVERLASWGISPHSINNFGRCQCGHKYPKTLRQLVKGLRNAVAHFRIEPRHHQGQCVGFDFRDKSGFQAEVRLEEVKTFVEQLAAYLEKP